MQWNHIGERIEKLRKKNALSLRQLGEKTGMSGQYLGLVEKGRRGLSVDSIVQLCNAMNVSADYLLFGRGITTAGVVDGLSAEQIDITLEIARRVTRFVNSRGGNEALIRELLRSRLR